MRQISHEAANSCLKPLGLQVDELGRIQSVAGPKNNPTKWVQHTPPRDALEHRNLSDRVLDWLEPAQWRLLRISLTNFSVESVIVLNRVVRSGFADDTGHVQDCLLFEYTGDARNDYEQNTLLSFVLNLLLLENDHGQLASAACARETLGFEDGVVQFVSDSDQRLNSAREWISEMKSAPLRKANWIVNAVGVHP